MPLQRDRGAIWLQLLLKAWQIWLIWPTREGGRGEKGPVLPHQIRASNSNISAPRGQTWKEDKHPMVNLADLSEKFRKESIWNMVGKANRKYFIIKYVNILHNSHIFNKIEENSHFCWPFSPKTKSQKTMLPLPPNDSKIFKIVFQGKMIYW